MEKVGLLENQSAGTKAQIKGFWQTRESPGAEIMLEEPKNISQSHRARFHMLLS